LDAKKIKILAIASVGGHWVQLLRLRPAFEDSEVVFVSTRPSFATMVEGNKFYSVTDASRWNKFKLVVSFFEIFRIIRKERPGVIVTTGAAPGLLGIFAGKVLGCKTVWVDSIANVEKLSMSGKIAAKVAGRVYTQWEDLAGGKVVYEGNIL